MERALRAVLGVLVGAALAFVAVWRWAPPPVVATLGLGHRVVLYFATPDAQYLVPEVRYVAAWQDTPLRRLELLTLGPQDRRQLAPVIPPGARPLSVTVQDGVAVADFSKELVERHWGGTAGELMTVYGIVNTLGELPGVKQVRITVEGRPLETLAGHLDLREPLAPDPDLVRRAEASRSQSAPSSPSSLPAAPQAGSQGPRSQAGGVTPLSSLS